MSDPWFPQRSRPSHGIDYEPDSPIIVYLTVCTENRRPWLATEANHALLRGIWSAADAWMIGRYVLMPDHLHLFAAPGAKFVEFDNWVRYWKSQFSKRHKNKEDAWQANHWDTRLRREESYDQKWEYVVSNPVRHGLVERVEDWPFQGELFPLRWN